MVNQGLVHFWAANWSVQKVEDALLDAFSSETKPPYLDTLVGVLAIHDAARRDDRLEEVIEEQDVLATRLGLPSRAQTKRTIAAAEQLEPKIKAKTMDFNREHMPSVMQNLWNGLNSTDPKQKARIEEFLERSGGENKNLGSLAPLLTVLEFGRTGSGRRKTVTPRERPAEVYAAITIFLKDGRSVGKTTQAGYFAVHGRSLDLNKNEDCETLDRLRRPVSELITLRRKCGF